MGEVKEKAESGKGGKSDQWRVASYEPMDIDKNDDRHILINSQGGIRGWYGNPSHKLIYEIAG